jgi:hypothetical protein
MITRRELVLGAIAVSASGFALSRSGATVSADPFCLVPAPRWSDPATWGGAIPAVGANVTLPQATVVLDVDASVGELSIPAGATLLFDPTTSRTLSAAGNIIVNGTLRARPDGPDVVSTVRFVNVTESAFVGGGMTPLESDVGLWVVGAGVLDVAGTPKTSWCRAATPLTSGASSVVLSSPPSGWRVGDTIAIAPSGYANNWEGYDTRTITSVSGATVGLSAPLTYNHDLITLEPGYTFGAEVMNLTRNVVVEGASKSAGRAHVFVSTSVPQAVSHIELRHLGPSGKFGRYPLHVHMSGDGSRGSAYTGVVVHDCGNLGIVPHGSHGCTFTACVVHDTNDRGFWWDVGDITNDTTYQSCVASWIRAVPAHRGFNTSGFTLGDGAGNRIFDCTTVGSQGNSDAAAFAWPEGTADAWETRRIIAHNCRRHGMGVWQNNGVPHLVQDFICAWNGASGINHGAYRNSYEYANGWLHANTQASVNLHALSVASDPVRFREVLCDAAGRHLSPVILPQHNLPSAQPVQFLGCEFVGHSGTTFRSIATSMVNPDVIDVVESGSVTVEWNANSHPASVIRVQCCSSAEQITPAGTTPIAPFSSYVATPRVPFAILASA